MSTRRLVAAVTIPLLAAACSDGSGPASTACDPSLPTVSLQPLQGTTVSAAQFGRCLQLEGGGPTYLLVPQFATEGTDPDALDFLLGTGDAGTTPVRASVQAGLPGAARGASVADRFHAMLRQRDAALALRAAAQEPAAAKPTAIRAQVAGAAPAAAASFKVLSKLDGSAFATVMADLKFAGQNIYVYVDQASPSAFSDADWQAFGKMFDETLFTIDRNAFGPPSDIDGNGHVITLFTPVVNDLIDPEVDGCNSYIAGFFTGFDLSAPKNPNSNKGEVFYASVPDPNQQFGCGLSTSTVEFLTPATFIHELQHMISWNQHVIERHGADEVVWLNEGMSLMAEELGARHYEAKFPPPLGRTNPGQLFPDSARGFIEPNLGYAYNSLTLQRDSLVSVTTYKDFGELEERGASWLFLRWLADHKGEEILTKLEQTSLRGVANVAAQAGEPFAQLFGDFSVALWTDSLPGVDRALIPERYRYTSRNFRAIFASMSASQPNRFPVAYPVNPVNLDFGSSTTTSMVPGAMSWFVLPTAGTASPVNLRFSRPDLTQLARSSGAQVSIFRLPDTP